MGVGQHSGSLETESEKGVQYSTVQCDMKMNVDKLLIKV